MDVGAMAAGFTPIRAIEIEQDIADVYRRNMDEVWYGNKGTHIKVRPITSEAELLKELTYDFADSLGNITRNHVPTRENMKHIFIEHEHDYLEDWTVNDICGRFLVDILDDERGLIDDLREKWRQEANEAESMRLQVAMRLIR